MAIRAAIGAITILDITDGTNATDHKWVFLESSSAPATPTDSSGLPSGGWLGTSPSSPTLDLYTSLGVKTNGIGNYVWQSPIRLTGEVGEIGTAATRERTFDVFLTQVATPSSPTVTSWNFTTEAPVGLTSSPAWSTTQPTISVNTLSKYWVARITVTEVTFGGIQTKSTVGPTQNYNFDGIVSFTNSNTITDGTTTATIGTATPWEAGTYATGAQVHHNGNFFEATASTSVEPPGVGWNTLVGSANSSGERTVINADKISVFDSSDVERITIGDLS